MTFRQLAAIIFSFVGASLAWSVLGSSGARAIAPAHTQEYGNASRS